jgi:hypothetical protein
MSCLQTNRRTYLDAVRSHGGLFGSANNRTMGLCQSRFRRTIKPTRLIAHLTKQWNG